MRIRDSLFGLLHLDVAEADSAIVERVRHAMLRAMDQYSDQEHLGLDAKLCHARDLAALWYLRPELMQAIASSKGEAAARLCMAGIAEVFQGYKPCGSTWRLPVIGRRP